MRLDNQENDENNNEMLQEEGDKNELGNEKEKMKKGR